MAVIQNELILLWEMLLWCAEVCSDLYRSVHFATSATELLTQGGTENLSGEVKL